MQIARDPRTFRFQGMLTLDPLPLTYLALELAGALFHQLPQLRVPNHREDQDDHKEPQDSKETRQGPPRWLGDNGFVCELIQQQLKRLTLSVGDLAASASHVDTFQCQTTPRAEGRRTGFS